MAHPFSAERHTVWFEPAGEVRGELLRIIRRLGARCSAPEFLPHITLLPGCTGPREELMRAAARLANSLRPFTVNLGEIDFREEYYRCLFVHAAPSKHLLKAYESACGEFGRHHAPEFMPHLSLLYGTFPLVLKQELRAEIGLRLDWHWKVRNLYLYRTHGGPRRWRQVAKFNL